MGGIKKAVKKVGGLATGGVMGATLGGLGGGGGGLFGGGSAPGTPDFASAAYQQAILDRETADKLTGWNRPTQVDALGNKLEWSRDNAGNWTQKETWSPSTLADFNAARGLASNSLSKLGQQGDFVAPEMVEFDPTSGDKLAADMYESVMGRARKEQGREQESWDLKLRQQGLQPGTEAYDRAMQNLMTSHGDVATQAGLQSTQAGYEEARQRYAQQLQGQQQNYNQTLQNYTLPWEQAQTAQSLVAGQSRPQFQGFNGASGYDAADLAGATKSGFEANMGKYNAKQQKKSNTLGAAASFGGAAMGASDGRLKTDIAPIQGKDAVDAILKLNGYTYRWKGSEDEDSGVLAQEVAAALPELVATTEDGLMLVKYSELMAIAVEAVKYLAKEHRQ